MSDARSLVDDPLAAGIRPIVITVLRMVASAGLVMLAYYKLPVQTDGSKSDLPFLLLHVAIFAVIVAVQVPVITRSRHPGLRAIEATVLTILIYLTLFARIYLSAALSDQSVFSEPLTHTRALYFAVTVFATVGFGDIVAVTESTQLLVTAQMLLNLVVIGVVIRVLITAGTRGMARRRSGDAPPALPFVGRRHRPAAEGSAAAAPPDEGQPA